MEIILWFLCIRGGRKEGFLYRGRGKGKTKKVKTEDVNCEDTEPQVDTNGKIFRHPIEKRQIWLERRYKTRPCVVHGFNVVTKLFIVSYVLSRQAHLEMIHQLSASSSSLSSSLWIHLWRIWLFKFHSYPPPLFTPLSISMHSKGNFWPTTSPSICIFHSSLVTFFFNFINFHHKKFIHCSRLCYILFFFFFFLFSVSPKIIKNFG